MTILRYASAILLVWWILALVFLVAWNWAKWGYQTGRIK